jgi:hypothetical protein
MKGSRKAGETRESRGILEEVPRKSTIGKTKEEAWEGALTNVIG